MQKPAAAVLASTLIASCLLLGTLVACGGGLAPSPPLGVSRGGAQAVRPHDLGRRNPRKGVRVVILLRYNHQAELERFVDRLERTHRPHYLTRREFIARYAPTVQQEQRVLSTLHAAGFRVTHRYANRLIVDAAAPSATVERFFSTEVHDFQQGPYGVRAANVRPLRIPMQLTPYVAAVEANDLVLAHKGIDASEMTPGVRRKNVVLNGDFYTGELSPWTSCGTADASISRKHLSRKHPSSGRFDALTGSTTKKREVKGWSAICQRVTVLPDSTLSVWLYQLSNEPNEKHAYQEIALANTGGKPQIVLAKTNANHAGWIHKSWKLAKYAGQQETLFFGVHGSGRAHYYDTQFIDDVRLTGTAPTASPSPTPRPPTPTPAPPRGWAPSAVASGLSMPSTEGDSGQRQTAAIVIDATASSSDLSTYLQQFSITRTGTVTNKPIDGGASNSNDAAEATLDVETIAALAPAANVIVYDVPQLSNTAIEDAYNQVVSDGKATVVNSSFGECEIVDPAFASTIDGIALGASAQGITFSASSGDTGPECYQGTYVAGVSMPASDPHFVSVGGTQSGTSAPYLPSSGPITNPAVWNDSEGAGGSGVSTIWTPPPYQQHLPGTQPSGRNVPDIAVPAAYDSLYFAGTWYLIWGTSWASPIYVAMQAEINQVCAEPQWGINTLYDAFAKTAYQYDFLDVVNGNNAYGGVSGYSAQPGFDNASGIGIPLGTQVATDDCGTRSAARGLHL